MIISSIHLPWSNRWMKVLKTLRVSSFLSIHVHQPSPPGLKRVCLNVGWIFVLKKHVPFELRYH